MSDLRIDILFY